MQFSWQIMGFETSNEINFEGVELIDSVLKIRWRRIGLSANGTTSVITGKSIVSAYDVEAASYVPFENITEEVSINWIIGSLPPERLTEIDQEILDRLSENENSNKIPPWLVVPEEVIDLPANTAVANTAV